MKFNEFLKETELETQVYPWMYKNIKDVKFWLSNVCQHTGKNENSFRIDSDLKISMTRMTDLLLSPEWDQQPEFMRKYDVPANLDDDEYNIDPKVLKAKGHKLLPKIFKSAKGITALPVMFDRVEGDFSIDYPITTLIGSPRSVASGGFFIYNSLIRDVKGFPVHIDGSVILNSHESIEDFTGMETGTHISSGSIRLKFKEIGSFEGMARNIEYITSICPIRSFKGLEMTSVKSIDIRNPNCGGLLPLVRCRNLKEIVTSYIEGPESRRLRSAGQIVIKHKNEGGDLISCKKELIAAGFQEYAKL